MPHKKASEPKTVEVMVTKLMVGNRPHVFVKNADANRRFLEGIDDGYWGHQAATHAAALEAQDGEERQRAAVALRVVYSQALETLLSLIGAFVQAPQYPLGWLLKYSNADLRLVVREIEARRRFPCHLKAPSWHAVAAWVFDHVPIDRRHQITARFATLWGRLAREFLDEFFEPEYNSLKHGMRASVGGFTLSVGRQEGQRTPAPADQMEVIGGSDYGSTIWLPRQLDGTRYTFDLAAHVSRAWVPAQFVAALPLIGMSIRNIANRALIVDGVSPSDVQLSHPADYEMFDAPWRERPSIGFLKFGGVSTDLLGWKEPPKEEFFAMYERYAMGPESDVDE